MFLLSILTILECWLLHCMYITCSSISRRENCILFPIPIAFCSQSSQLNFQVTVLLIINMKWSEKAYNIYWTQSAPKSSIFIHLQSLRLFLFENKKTRRDTRWEVRKGGRRTGEGLAEGNEQRKVKTDCYVVKKIASSCSDLRGIVTQHYYR